MQLYIITFMYFIPFYNSLRSKYVPRAKDTTPASGSDANSFHFLYILHNGMVNDNKYGALIGKPERMR